MKHHPYALLFIFCAVVLLALPSGGYASSRESTSKEPSTVAETLMSFIKPTGSLVTTLSAIFVIGALSRGYLAKKSSDKIKNADDIRLALSTRLNAYLCYGKMAVLGIIRAAVWTVSLRSHQPRRKENWHAVWWKELFTQHMYTPLSECWGRPIASAPSSEVKVCIRERPKSGFISSLLYGFLPFRLTGEQRKCLNMASYNYLGFGGVDQDCTPACVEAIKKYGLSFGKQRSCVNSGSSPIHLELEKEVAKFLGKEDALVVGMGYATNSTLIPAVICDGEGSAKGVLILSDELNHKSIVAGCRLSGASIKSLKHGDMGYLEHMLQKETSKGCWRKIFVFVEGVYSMEGSYGKIREIVQLKRKYGFYIWLDEAHSIGAVGPSGRGVTELLQIPTEHIDIMMGTFTKSFGSAGGYIAADRALIDQVRRLSVGFVEASSMTPVCAQQALSAFQAMQAPRGLQKIRQLRENCDYFREQLVTLGCHVVGALHSPVQCVLLPHPDKCTNFSHEALKRNVAVVVVGYPATPVLLSRARFCCSASHTREDINKVIQVIREVVDVVGVKYAAGQEPLDVKRLFEKDMAVDLGSDDDKVTPWTPEPLADAKGATPVQNSDGNSHAGHIDASRHDPLNLLSDPPAQITKVCIDKIQEVGCGTCGPRGFYGTTTDHLALEEAIAKFLGTEGAILYSHHVATTSSVIPAFIKKGDVVLARSDPIGTCSLQASGIRLSNVADISIWASCDELETALAASAKKLAASTKKSDQNSRIWIITEGGNVDLQRVVALKRTFGAYLLLDDTYCIGVAGSTGRGTVERCGVDVSEVDCLIGSLEHAFGAVGGFCAGRSDIVSHQRLYGDGYCFSASAPTCLMAAAAKAIEFLQTTEGIARLQSLQTNIDSFVTLMQKQCQDASMQLLTSRGDYAQIVKLPGHVNAADVHIKLKSVKTEPVQVSPLGLKLLSAYQPKNFGAFLPRLLQINIHAQMTAKEIGQIVAELGETVHGITI